MVDSAELYLEGENGRISEQLIFPLVLQTVPDLWGFNFKMVGKQYAFKKKSYFTFWILIFPQASNILSWYWTAIAVKALSKSGNHKEKQRIHLQPFETQDNHCFFLAVLNKLHEVFNTLW